MGELETANCDSNLTQQNIEPRSPWTYRQSKRLANSRIALLGTSLALSLTLLTSPHLTNTDDVLSMPTNPIPSTLLPNLDGEVSISSINTPDYSQVISQHTVDIGVFLVNPANIPSSQPFNLADAQRVFTGPGLDSDGNQPVIEYLKQQTFGTTNFTVRFFPWTPSRAISCNQVIGNPAQADLAARHGLRTQDFQVMVLAFPQLTNCNVPAWAGNGTVYLNGQVSIRSGEHEIGHALGLGHAALWVCTEANIYNDANCRTDETGGAIDPMGNALYMRSIGNFNAPNKIRLQAIPSNTIQEVTRSGEYQLYPIDKPTSITKVLRIPKRDSISNDAYYVELTPHGVIINVWNGQNGINVPTKQVTTAANNNVWGLLNMTNRTFIDTPNGIKLELTDISPELAKLVVSTL